MRHTIRVTKFFIIAALAVGCTTADAKSTVERRPNETAAAQLDKAKTETKEAEQAMRDYAYAQKTEFVDKMKEELVKIQNELDRLAVKVDSSSDAAKADAKSRLDAVHEKWTQAKKQLDRAESATESGWDDVKGGFKKSYGELKDSCDKTRQWLSDKIEP